MTEQPQERLANVTATAMLGKKIMTDRIGQPISETIQCSTDVPADALGEVVDQVLSAAWRMGLDPALDKDFHIDIIFT